MFHFVELWRFFFQVQIQKDKDEHGNWPHLYTIRNLGIRIFLADCFFQASKLLTAHFVVLSMFAGVTPLDSNKGCKVGGAGTPKCGTRARGVAKLITWAVRSSSTEVWRQSANRYTPSLFHVYVVGWVGQRLVKTILRPRVQCLYGDSYNQQDTHFLATE